MNSSLEKPDSYLLFLNIGCGTNGFDCIYIGACISKANLYKGFKSLEYYSWRQQKRNHWKVQPQKMIIEASRYFESMSYHLNEEIGEIDYDEMKSSALLSYVEREN